MLGIYEEIETIYDLSKNLTKENIIRLENSLDMPSGLREIIKLDPIDFLYAFKDDWEGFSPGRFHVALRQIGRNDLIPLACRVPWLCKHPDADKEIPIKRTTKTFIRLLINEIDSDSWKLILRTISVKCKGKVQTIDALNICFENKLLTKNFEELCYILGKMERNDVVDKILSYQDTFAGKSEKQLKEDLSTEIRYLRSKDNEWQKQLRRFILEQNKDVTAVLNEKPVSLESIYTPLTIIKIKPDKRGVWEESGITEIKFLRSMHSKAAHKIVEVVNFVDLVMNTSDYSKGKIWSVTGNPGCGKSFLCKNLAFLYGNNSLNNFLYVVSVPCRSDAWHELEKERHENNQTVDTEFVESWLLLSMSPTARWSKSLCNHLIRSNGEGLLIIIDGFDEFIQNIPFDSTFFNLLLTRKFLARSTIIVTSRPSAWSDLLYRHGTEYRIEANFQVLGFSTHNRDVYFSKRIDTQSKLNSVYELFNRHDEIKQLSLVPVNASLFSALFNELKSVLTHTLTFLYTELVIYLIKRQLTRIGLIEYCEASTMSGFHHAIKECVEKIGLEANQGIFNRELTSDTYIPLKIGGNSYECERLGLMQSRIKVVSVGRRITVWNFQHLSLQEYMSAVSISFSPWTDQCLVIRYLSSSSQYLTVYKMVIRFVGGILGENAGRITPILCRHIMPDVLSLREVPSIYKLYFLSDIFQVSDWLEFSQSFLYLCSVIGEINSSVDKHFRYFETNFPELMYLYLQFTIAPNEWHCFLQSLLHIREFQIIHINSGFVSSTQFRSFLNHITTVSVHYLALVFVKKDFKSVYSYTSLLSSFILSANTKISISLETCDLTACDPSRPLIHSTNRIAGSLMLYQSDIYQQTLFNLTNQFSSLETLFFSPKSNDSDWSIIRNCIIRIQLNELYILDLNGHLPELTSIISRLSSIKYLYWETKGDCYKALPYLSHLKSLTSLCLFSPILVPFNESRKHPLMSLIGNNSLTLRELNLVNLHRIGIYSWKNFFSCVTFCSNLMILVLISTNFNSNDISCWHGAVVALKSLVQLTINYVPLRDAGMVVLCNSLSNHPALRRLRVTNCNLTSESCLPLGFLIQTLPCVRLLKFNKRELSTPDTQQLPRLLTTAEECSAKIEFR